MKRIILLCALLLSVAAAAFAQSPPPLTIQEADGSPKQTNATKLIFNCSGCVTKSGTTLTVAAGAGGVAGPASATDNAIARFDGTTGKLVQNSTVFVDDAGLLQIGGTTSSFPALKASGTTLQARTADDGGFTTVQAGSFSAISNVVLVNTTSLITINGDTGFERDAAGVMRATDASTGAGGILIGASSATGAAGALTVVGAGSTTTINGAALSGSSTTSNFVNVTGTMPTTMSATTYGLNHQITSAGSSGQLNAAFNIDYLAGYTGGENSVGIRVANAAAGTNTLFANGNRALQAASSATTTGNNLGVLGTASGGNLSIGGHLSATTNKNSATNVGVAGFGLNGGSSPVQVGGYFALANAYPTFVSAALIANNGAQTDPIFRAQDNGTDVFQIVDGGAMVLTAKLFANLGTPANGSFFYCSDCTIANPCAGSGTGAFAKRLNAVWVCN